MYSDDFWKVNTNSIEVDMPFYRGFPADRASFIAWRNPLGFPLFAYACKALNV